MKPVFQTGISSERRLLMALISGGLLFGLLMICTVAPAHMPFAECAFRSITGHSCLTCGLTRSLHALAHGDLIASIRYHLFGPAVFSALLLCLAIFGAEAISGRRVAILTGRRTGYKIIIAFGLSWILYWVLRLVSECVG